MRTQDITFRLTLVIALSVLISGCLGDLSIPTAVMSEAELQQRQTDTIAFVNRFHETWLDINWIFYE